MGPDEMNRYIRFLLERLLQKDAQHKKMLEQLAEIKDEFKTANSEQQHLSALVLSLTNQLHEAQQENVDLARKDEGLQSFARVSKKHRFGSSSQKGCKALDDVSGRDDNKDDFDKHDEN